MTGKMQWLSGRGRGNVHASGFARLGFPFFHPGYDGVIAMLHQDSKPVRLVNPAAPLVSIMV